MRSIRAAAFILLCSTVSVVHGEVRVGQRVRITNSKTGKVGDGRVTGLVTSGTYRDAAADPVHLHAIVEFDAPRTKAIFSTKQLELTGQPLSVKRKFLRQLDQEVRTSIAAVLGLDASAIAVRSLRGYSTRAGHLGTTPFDAAYRRSDKNGAGRSIGFYDRNLPGQVHVKREQAGFEHAVRIHETLHALSHDFNVVALSGYRIPLMGLNEALTEYFTSRVMYERLAAQPSYANPYAEHARYGEALAKQVGESTLKAIFFNKDGAQGRPIERLAELVDAKLGRGAFEGSVRTLESGRVEAAVELLQAR